MTISTATNKAQFSGNGVTTAFPFAFKTFVAGDLDVYLTSALGVDSTLALTTHYTISLSGDQDASPGGTLTMLTAPATGETLTILRSIDATQLTDITNGGGFYPQVIENALDKLTMLAQQNAEKLDRAIVVGVTDTMTANELLAELAASEAAAAASAATAASDAATANDAAVAAAASAASIGSTVTTANTVTLSNKTLDQTNNIASSGGHLSGFRNLLINSDFRINQRAYVSAAALASGVYGHDRWKGGASGGNYTFTQLAHSTQITIASGKSIIQVVEDKNVVGGSYILSWEGAAQARYGLNSATPSGSYASSPILITGQTAGTVISVEFNTGTLGKVQLEQGTIATSFENRPYGTELALCQRYYQRVRTYLSGYNGNGANIMFYCPLVYAPMRTVVSGVLVTEHTISNLAAAGRALVGQTDNSGYSSAQALATGLYICDRTYALETEL